MPIPCFLPEGADVLVGYDASRRAFLARAVTEQGKVGVVVLGRADLRAAEVFTIHRAAKPKGLRSRREGYALAYWAAAGPVAPPYEGGGAGGGCLDHAAAFLRELAAKQRTPYAVRLRRAAALLEEGEEQAALRYVAEAACIGLGLPAALQ